MKNKKKKRKRKNYSHKTFDAVAQYVAQTVQQMNANFQNYFKRIDNHAPSDILPVPSPRMFPNPSRIKFSPGIHPGIIHLMDIVFV